MSARAGFNWSRAERLVRRMASRKRGYFESADKTWTIYPPAATTIAPALHLPGAVEKIRSLSPYRNWTNEQLLIDGGAFQLRATSAYLLRDVNIVGGMLYRGSTYTTEGALPSPWWLQGRLAEREQMAQAHLVSSESGTQFFGCMLLDDFTLELLPEHRAHNISLEPKATGHEPAYRDLLGINPKKTVYNAHVRELTHYVDAAWNAHKAERYRELRRRLRRALEVQGSAAGQRPLIYLRRGMSGQRRVVSNELQIEASLVKRGFVVLDPMQLSAEQISRTSMNARCVVSIEGSQISHTIFAMADDAALVILQPPDRFCLQYKEYTDAMGMRCGFLVGTPGADGFSIDETELLRLLDTHALG